MYEYAGHMHIHSTHSDGSGTIPDIAAAARRAGLDFIVITDHNSLGGRTAGDEGVREGVLVLIGVELEVEGRGEHCLVLGLKEVPPAASARETFFAQIRAGGGAAFLAHPCERGSPVLYQGRAFVWDPVPEEGFDGLEIWNYSSRWKDGCPNVPAAFARYYLKQPGLALSPCPLTLASWDRLSRIRPVSAVGGSDAHAVLLKVGPLRPVLFPYEDLFRGVNMHVYLREPLRPGFPEAAKQLIAALRQGNSFVAYDGRVNSRGFSCFIEQEGGVYLPGEHIPLGPRALLQVQAPSPRCRLTLLNNGLSIHTAPGPRLTYLLDKPGTYRVEAKLKPALGRPHPWIYANPFYVV
jgi:hypothetical protein